MRKSNVATLTLAVIGIIGLGLAAASTADAANVNVARNGRGSVTGAIITGTVISCPSDCSEFVLAGNITLTATPTAGWTFGRWDGRCTGSTSTSCTFAVPILEDVTVTATFNAAPAIFVVDSTHVDAVDADPGNGVCRTAGPAEACTLRAAIQEVNALVRNPQAHTIRLLPGATYRLTIPGTNENNSATGDLDIRNAVQIEGSSEEGRPTVIDGNGLDRVITVDTPLAVSIKNVTITNGKAPSGGGLDNKSTSLTLTNVIISGNDTAVADLANGKGGGIDNEGVMSLIGVTISGNTANYGGGLHNHASGMAVLNNVTISGNVAGQAGGGLYNFGIASLANVTVSGNAASVGGGGLFNGGVRITLANVILQGNAAGTQGNCGALSGTALLSEGHNLSSDPSCALWLNRTGDRNATDARLGPLQFNGGFTPTHALLPGSPAIDGGNNAGCPLSDQRAITRPIGGACDIGAVEYQGSREEFVIRFYGGVLGRSPEPDGLAAWTAALRASCSPQSFAALSGSFFDSLEFRTKRPHSVNGLVALLYRTFLGRDPEAAGVAGWASILRQVRLAVALEGFVPSQEFQGLLPDRTNRAAVTALVTRLYQQLLGREPDPAGLQSFVDFIVTTGNLEGAATGFLASPEFESRPQTARDYVTILYATFLDRTPDPAGLEAWEGILRQALLTIINAGFVPSPEFQGLVPQVCG